MPDNNTIFIRWWCPRFEWNLTRSRHLFTLIKGCRKNKFLRFPKKLWIFIEQLTKQTGIFVLSLLSWKYCSYNVSPLEIKNGRALFTKRICHHFAPLSKMLCTRLSPCIHAVLLWKFKIWHHNLWCLWSWWRTGLLDTMVPSVKKSSAQPRLKLCINFGLCCVAKWHHNLWCLWSYCLSKK